MKTLPLLIALFLFFGRLTAQNGSILFEDDFNAAVLNGWHVENEDDDDTPNWYLDSGYLVQDSNIGDSYQRGTNLIKNDSIFSNFTLRTLLYSTDDDYIGIVFRYQDINNYYKFIVSSQNKKIQLQKRANGILQILDSYTAMEWPLVGFTVTITAYNDTLKVYLEDKLYLEATNSQFSSGYIGLMSCYNNGNFFDWIKIYDTFEIPPISDEIVVVRGPYLQSLTDSSAAVLWGTNKAEYGSLQIGLDSVSYQTINEYAYKTNHMVKIDGLSENTEYFYRIKMGETYSKWTAFTTFAKTPDSFSFILYGDTRTNFLRHREVTANFADHNFDFIVHTGDPVQRGPRDDWNVEFFNPLQKYIQGKTLFSAIGNHELNAQNFYDYFEFPDKEHENYYSFTLGNTFFIFIDNNSARYDDSIFPSIVEGSPQYIWLEERLSSEEAANAQWVFVFSHIPVYYNKSFDTYPICRDNLKPLFEKYKIDFSFVGHIHGYERGFRNDINYVLTGGGGGTGPVKDDGYVDPGYPQEEYPFREIYNFCKVEVSNTTVKLTAYDIYGKKFDGKTVSATGINDDQSVNTVLTTRLFDAYPNPFNPVTEIAYNLSKDGNVKLTVYNILGQPVTTLVNRWQKAGKYRVTFNANSLNGQISSGLYFYHIQAEGYSSVKKMMLLK